MGIFFVCFTVSAYGRRQKSIVMFCRNDKQFEYDINHRISYDVYKLVIIEILMLKFRRQSNYSVCNKVSNWWNNYIISWWRNYGQIIWHETNIEHWTKNKYPPLRHWVLSFKQFLKIIFTALK